MLEGRKALSSKRGQLELENATRGWDVIVRVKVGGSVFLIVQYSIHVQLYCSALPLFYSIVH
jgi:hypothetical protein